MRVAIVRYKGGNTLSVANALARIGADPVVTDSPEIIVSADRVIIPGVGEASTAMASLRAAGLCDLIRRLDQPVLGICLGMQLLCSYSEENDTECLGILPNRVFKLRADNVKVPHTGWNTVEDVASGLFSKIDDGTHMYFVHSYYVARGDTDIATTHHGLRFASAVSKGNFYGVQFHPEKSGEAGERLLRNFIEL